MYLALENGKFLSGSRFCLRWGCTRYVSIPNFAIQRTVAVDCTSGKVAALIKPLPAGICNPCKLLRTDYSSSTSVVASGLDYWSAIGQATVLNARRVRPSDDFFTVQDCSGRLVK